MQQAIKIPCSLVVQGNTNLLIPNSAILEVVKTPLDAMEHKSPLVGHITWEGQQLPVFDEGRAGYIAGPPLFVIVRTPTDNRLFAFASPKIPRSMQANQHSVSENPRPKETRSFALSYIQIDEISAIIPDLDSCFRKIHDLSCS